MVILKRMWRSMLLCLLVAVLLPVGHFTADAASMTQYRVYQNDKPLKEFARVSQAIAYAKYYSYSHVEKISNREWVWHNLPKYKVYINGESSSKLEYATLTEAKKAASSHINAYVRDLEGIGWAYENFANYVLYQGDKTYDHWQFYSLDDAKKEAKKWTNAHIMNVNSKQWVWDNLTASMIKEQRDATAKYSIYKDGELAAGSKSYAFLKDAIEAANKLSNSEVINTATGKSVHQNLLNFEVYSQGKLVKLHSTLDAAVKTAKGLYAAEVKQDDKLLWSSVHYLSVYQGEKLIKSFHSINGALAYAKNYSNSYIMNQDGRKLWSSSKNFVFMGWNGSSSVTTIKSHISNTQGLDIDSPTWYYVDNENGAMNSNVSAALVNEMKAQGIDIIPLVHNQFDKELTTKFLADEKAQDRFIKELIDSLVSIKVKGLNLDFENLAASDRNQFTSFVQKLTKAAHAKKLTVSIDLMRGDVRWNHLTAYDYEELGKIVDTVIMMAYDEHWTGSDTPGSVGSIGWVEEGIKQYLEYGIPRSKLILGIPFYSREWRIDSNGKLVDNRAILMKDIDSVVSSNKATRTYDEKAGQYKYTYTKDGYTHVFWAETTESVLARVKLAKEYDLAGVAAWRLGYEDSSLWEAMLKVKEQ